MDKFKECREKLQTRNFKLHPIGLIVGTSFILVKLVHMQNKLTRKPVRKFATRG